MRCLPKKTSFNCILEWPLFTVMNKIVNSYNTVRKKITNDEWIFIKEWLTWKHVNYASLPPNGRSPSLGNAIWYIVNYNVQHLLHWSRNNTHSIYTGHSPILAKTLNNLNVYYYNLFSFFLRRVYFVILFKTIVLCEYFFFLFNIAIYKCSIPLNILT
jgi:hypothetical protein